MSENIQINRRTAKIVLFFFSILPLTILTDEMLYRLNPEMMFQYEILINFGYHTINAQSAIADVFFFAALFLLAQAIFKRR